MKKIICFACAILLCLGMSVSVFAATTEFVPSISYKDGPDIMEFSFDGEDFPEGTETGDCLVVTSIKQANEKTTDITQETRDELLDVYKKLSDGSMTLPIDSGYVIRELVDVSFKYESCVSDPEHGNKPEQLKKPDVTLTVKFDLGVAAGTDVVVMTYIDGKWQEIESVVNNGDGTVTCVFEDICPVVFAVKQGQNTPTTPPQTGDTVGQYLYLWIGVMVLSAAALVTLIVVASKKKAQ